MVVRPTEKRNKKKAKRTNDTTRQTYVSMLAATHGKHEADSEASSTYELEVQISPDEEAHQVAKVLGLPAKFDPTIKPLQESVLVRSKSPDAAAPGPRTSVARRVVSDPEPPSAPNSEDEEDDEEGEFEVMTGAEVLDQQKKLDQLHKMEASEAAALKLGVNADEEEESDEAQGQNAGSAS